MKNKELKELKEKVAESLNRKTDEEIDEEFSDLIRNIMSDKQFWKYVASWKDAYGLCDEMENWDTDTKREEIDIIRKSFKIKEDEE